MSENNTQFFGVYMIIGLSYLAPEKTYHLHYIAHVNLLRTFFNRHSNFQAQSWWNFPG